MIQIGSVIDDRYEILKEIGRGGMSIVYLAMDNRLNKSLVVKDIRKRQNSNNELLIHSLIVESNMLKRLDHGALPKIYDIIDSEGDIYVVMDYIEGESLKEKLKREKKIPANDVIKWAKQLAEVLDYLHTRKPFPIIYRDMKPDNVMLTPDGKVKLIDFGIAREYKTDSTTDTTNLGTKTYAAPEQISGQQTDARTDIYSLGVTLYHLVTGKSINEPPYELKPIREWDPTLPEGLEHIILRCTQSEPSLRYQNAQELLYDLENINKLTNGYKNKLKRKISLFLLPVLLCLIFAGTSVYGFNGIKNNQFLDYMRLVGDANNYSLTGEYDKAAEMLELAITTVDEKRPNAYLDLIDLYIKQDQTDTGLNKVETYISNKYGNIQKNNEVLFKVGMTYFDIKRDYVSAIRYFSQVDSEEIPAVKYYQTLATTLSSMNIDYAEFTSYLEAFEAYNDSLPNDRKKVDNYYSLANIYSSYKGQISEANTKTISTIQKAYDVLAILENDNFNSYFEGKFESKLAQAYYSRGINAAAKELAKEDFQASIEHYYSLLDLEEGNAAEVMLRIGVIYQEMGDTQKAIEQMELTIEQHPDFIDTYIKLGNLLLDIEQGKREKSRDYTKAIDIYEEAQSVPGSVDNNELRKLKRRFENLDLL